MSTDKQLQVAWIGAGAVIVAAVIALVPTVFIPMFSGDDPESGSTAAASSPASAPPSAPPSTAGPAPSTSTSSSAPASATPSAGPTPGTVLGSYTVKLPNGYGFAVKPVEPTQDDLGLAPQEVWYNARIYANLGAEMLDPGPGKPTYEACRSSTVFVTASEPLARGVAFCVKVADTVAGFEVLDRDAKAPPYTATLRVTVWQR